ncbi:hypothetical protein [Lutibacter sp.]|uniref:hypothetical protein n=1 Tax=Lutibacter sp. TaxID=1925666 RepID=UPI0025BFD041|nr:hypothetical protein [Lutibacter sp.]MCF6180520.1 hypothetical protein [Lutibacter sp.]
MKKGFFLVLFFLTVVLHAQSPATKLKSFLVKNDTIKIDSVSISSFDFKVFKNDSLINPSEYSIDFSKAQLIFNNRAQNKLDSIKIQYKPYPKFLTKKYQLFDKKLIVTNNTSQNLYSLTTNKSKKINKPFEGLNAVGNITRGLTIGNNQNGVVNSSLDLQIAGKISDKVTLKGSIIDTNIPIQENGNTYKLNEFDRVFIELFSKNWKITAGDIYLNNSETKYLNFNKKVSGLAVNAIIKNKHSEINIETSGAVVRGKYKKVEFVGEEGNQGPYKLNDLNNNSYILILSGTENIYINGQLLKRGENNDYTIDYNNAELTFNTTFPITANMRISAEFQFNDRVFTRFITYNNIKFKSEKLVVSSYFYNENDVKNQPLEQDLTDAQKQILANAGNDLTKMASPSAYIDTYSDNKILYKKTPLGTSEIFEYSTNENDILYHVSFSFVGANLGNYKLKEVIAIGKVYEYIGANLGNYNPIIKLTAPNKLQVAVFKANYQPSVKTSIQAEAAFSINDANLFSTIDDENNNGFATQFNWNQIIYSKKWELKSQLGLDYIDAHFKSIQRIQNIEFNRDWNIVNLTGKQQLITTGLQLNNQQNSSITYKFENLLLGNSFTGNKHHLFGNITQKNFAVNFDGSILENASEIRKGTFSRYHLTATYTLGKSWFGTQFSGENNEQTSVLTQLKENNSHKFNEYEGFFGIGDSTKIFTQIGAKFRVTDSIQNNKFERVNNSKTYYLKSNFIKSKTANLSTYINYRTVKNTNFKDEESLNSKLVYQQQLFHQFLNFSTVYQTLSGTLPQQDYSYLKTEPGQGYYTWIDYNNNGIKELNEFEIAQFPDQAEYLRIILPTINYIATHQNKFTQTIRINAQQWSSKKGFKKTLSHFNNQTYILVDNKQLKQPKKFNLNPFDISNPNVLALNYHFTNSIYFNRGKKHFTTSYSYQKSKNVSTTTIDNLSNNLQIQQLTFEHKVGKFWLFYISGNQSKNTTNSLNYSNRNFKLKNYSFAPKLSYYYNRNVYFSMFYEYKNKENLIQNLEALQLNKFGFEFNSANNTKNSLKITLNLFNNKFKGNANSPVGYQMLEGFQVGKNYTWSFLFHRKINSYLHLNINYLGRKSETSNTIHTGSIQLKAIF